MMKYGNAYFFWKKHVKCDVIPDFKAEKKFIFCEHVILKKYPVMFLVVLYLTDVDLKLCTGWKTGPLIPKWENMH